MEEQFADQKAEWGFDMRELWHLDSNIARWILPRLKKFKEFHVCLPAELTATEWDNILQEMIEGFEEAAQLDTRLLVDEVRIKRGLELFASWYRCLWW